METPPVISKTTVSKSLTKLSLTPCRRVGLGRPSSGSLQKIAQVRTANTPLHISSISSRENSSSITQNKTNSTPVQDLNPHSVTHKHSFGLNKNFTRVRRCLTQDIKRNSEESELETGYSLNETESNVGNCRRDTNLTEKPELKRLKMSKFESPNTNQSTANKKENQSLLAFKVSPIKEDIYSIGQDGDIPEKIMLQLMSSLLEKKNKLDQLKVQDLYSKKHNLEELRAQSNRWKAAGQDALRHCVALAEKAGYSITILQLIERHGFPVHLMGYNADDDEFE